MGILRLLLALSVLCAHLHGKAVLGFRLLNGELAVESFYMVSGFYMALVLNEKYRPGQYWTFLQQRFLRLWPLYALITLLSLLVFGTATWWTGKPQQVYWFWDRSAHFMDPISLVVCLVPNLTIFGQDILYFLAVDPATGHFYFTSHYQGQPIPAMSLLVVGQAWSLGVELTFYLMAPWLVRLSPARQGMLLLGLLVLRIASTFWGWTGDPWNDRFFPFELTLFLAGSLGYRYYAAHKEGLQRLGARMSWLKWLFYIIVITYSRLPNHSTVGYYLFVPLLFVVLPYLFATTKDLGWDRELGELSYPFYLMHYLVLFSLDSWVRAHINQSFWGITYTSVTLALSWVLYRFFEMKTERFRHHLLNRKTRTAIS